MEQLTLEQRARDFAEMLYPGKGAYYICIKDGYVAGAEWQKEQYKEVIEELRTNHEFLLTLYRTIDTRRNGLDFNSIQQDMRDRMAKQLELIEKATK